MDNYTDIDVDVRDKVKPRFLILYRIIILAAALSAAVLVVSGHSGIAMYGMGMYLLGSISLASAFTASTGVSFTDVWKAIEKAIAAGENSRQRETRQIPKKEKYPYEN